MFSKIIASSMNVDTVKSVHPSFVEIIKQLTPIDATNLQPFVESNDPPIARYNCTYKNSGFDTLALHVFLPSPINYDIDEQASSISNLCRLGLVEVSYSAYLVEDSHYKIFTEIPPYTELKKAVLEKKKTNPDCGIDDIFLQKGIISLTPLGQDFVKICIK